MKKLFISLFLIFYLYTVPCFGLTECEQKQQDYQQAYEIYEKNSSDENKDQMLELDRFDGITNGKIDCGEKNLSVYNTNQKIWSESEINDRNSSNKITSELDQNYPNYKVYNNYQTFTGPRGGIYHYNKNGKKVYNKRK